MTNLRAEAAKVVRKKLGLHVDPRKVTITCKPFPKRKTVYLWKINGDLNETEKNLIARTINSESVQRRYFRSWSDHERVQLTSLIKKEAILPEYYVKKGNRSDLQSAAWELLSSDTEDDEEGVEGEDLAGYQSNGDRSQLLVESTSERPTKRSRETSTSNDNRTSPEALVQNAVGSVPDSQPIVTSTVFQTPSVVQIAKRCSLQPSQSPLPQSVSLETTSRQETPKRIIPTPPRTMSLNSNGILELDPMPTTVTPSPTTPIAAIAASPYTPITDTLALFMEYNKTDRHPGDERNNEMAKVAITDMEIMMQAFIKHSAIGFLEIPRLWSEKRALKREYEEKESRYEERLSFLKRELEQQVKLSCDKESMFKGIISSLETENARNIKDKVELEKQNGSLQEEVNTIAKERDSMQHQINVLEQDLASSRASEKHSRHNESVMKDCYQRLGAEHDKLKETTDLEAKELKENIEALENSQSELQSRLVASAETHRSKEAALQEKILALESNLKNSMAEKESLHDSLKLLEKGLQESFQKLLQKL